MKKWKLLLNSNGSDLCEFDVNRGIFQGDSLSPLIFIICMIPLSPLLRKVKASYEWGREEFKLNHLLYMDDLKLFGKSDDQIDSLVQCLHLVEILVWNLVKEMWSGYSKKKETC